MKNTPKQRSAKAIAAICFFTIVFAFGSLHLPNRTNLAYGQGDIVPFEIGDMIGIESSSKMTSNDTLPNDSDTTSMPNENASPESENCVMPPCPPGHACIQSCPEVS
jgi:hypothetical protein